MRPLSHKCTCLLLMRSFFFVRLSGAVHSNPRMFFPCVLQRAACSLSLSLTACAGRMWSWTWWVRVSMCKCVCWQRIRVRRRAAERSCSRHREERERERMGEAVCSERVICAQRCAARAELPEDALHVCEIPNGPIPMAGIKRIPNARPVREGEREGHFSGRARV